MKKLTLLFGAAVLALTSCSKTDSTSSDTNAVLLQKSYAINNGPSVILTYNGSKIVSVGDFVTYTYTGDLITSMTKKNANQIFKVDYTYDAAGILSSEVTSDNGGTGTVLNPFLKTTYTYNTDGTVIGQNYNYSNDTYTESGTTKFTFANGNLIKQEKFDTNGISTEVSAYEYDSKKNSFYNITGYNKLIGAGMPMCKNNATSFTRTFSGTTNVITYVYNYNEQGYPLTVQSTAVNNGSTPNVSNTTYTY